MKRRSRGFTLIELLIVVAIIGILAAVGIPTYQGFVGDAKVKASTEIHARVVNFMTATLTKCAGGATTVALPPLTYSCKVTSSSRYYVKHRDYIWRVWENRFNVYFRIAGFKNPYRPEWSGGAVGICGRAAPGYTCMEFTPHYGARFTIRTYPEEWTQIGPNEYDYGTLLTNVIPLE